MQITVSGNGDDYTILMTAFRHVYSKSTRRSASSSCALDRLVGSRVAVAASDHNLAFHHSVRGCTAEQSRRAASAAVVVLLCACLVCPSKIQSVGKIRIFSFMLSITMRFGRPSGLPVYFEHIVIVWYRNDVTCGLFAF